MYVLSNITCIQNLCPREPNDPNHNNKRQYHYQHNPQSHLSCPARQLVQSRQSPLLHLHNIVVPFELLPSSFHHGLIIRQIRGKVDGVLLQLRSHRFQL